VKDRPTAKIGLARIWGAFLYSLNGLRYAIRNESAFREEIIIYVILLLILYVLPLSLLFKSILFFANTLVLVVELLNSAVESVVDIASPDYNELARRAKDLGSAAVFVSIVLAIALWGFAVYTVLSSPVP
jgi:diacylglycerol kinase (ATP)